MSSSCCSIRSHLILKAFKHANQAACEWQTLTALSDRQLGLVVSGRGCLSEPQVAGLSFTLSPAALQVGYACQLPHLLRKQHASPLVAL